MTMRAKRVMQAKLPRIQVNMYPVTGFADLCHRICLSPDLSVTGFVHSHQPLQVRGISDVDFLHADILRLAMVTDKGWAHDSVAYQRCIVARSS
jgi:hypothetical protein